MTSEAPRRVGFFLGLTLVLFTLFGAVAILASLGSWVSEILADEPVIVGRGKVIGFNDRAPYDTTSRKRSFVLYPVVEYHDKAGKRRELSNRSAFRGHFSIGDEVRIGKRDGREFVSDFWFRSHEPIMGILVGIAAISFAAVSWYKLK
jgi:hypothetical protein